MTPIKIGMRGGVTQRIGEHKLNINEKVFKKIHSTQTKGRLVAPCVYASTLLCA
jgi:hypothetical protein